MSDQPAAFHVIHLDDQKSERDRFRRYFTKTLERRLAVWFREHFGRADWTFTLTSCATATELHGVLIQDVGQLTPVGERALLFVLDYYLDPNQPDHGPITSSTVDGLPLPAWLDRTWPAVPKLVLTAGNTSPLTSNMPGSRWEGVPKPSGAFALGETKRIAGLFSKWWSPTFWAALHAHAVERGHRPWHTPGHAAGRSLERSAVLKGFHEFFGERTFHSDISVSVPALGDLSEPLMRSPLSTSMSQAASTFGASDTFFVTNGTSTANKALLMTLLKPGEVVLLDRNCHKSVHQAVVMSDAIPLYLPPAFNHRLGVWMPLRWQTIKAFLEYPYPEALRPRMLVLTTATYDGVLYPIEQISALCDEQGILLYADEAWAPHLRFHPRFATGTARLNATDAGAHVVVQSTHKTLSAFSQASMIHATKFLEQLFEVPAGPQWDWLKDRFGTGSTGYSGLQHELVETLRYWHSTSPNYPLLASLDLASAQMSIEGTRVIAEALRVADFLRERLLDRTGRPAVATLDDLLGPGSSEAYPAYAHDPLKLLVTTAGGRGHERVKARLEDAGIQWEKASMGSALRHGGGGIEFLVTPGSDLSKAEEVCLALQATDVKKSLGLVDPHPDHIDDWIETACRVAVRPRAAVAAVGMMRSLSAAVGCVAGQFVVPYPPGIPTILPGVVITQSAVDAIHLALANNGEVHGLFNPDEGDPMVKVVTQEEATRLAEGLEDFTANVGEPLLPRSYQGQE